MSTIDDLHRPAQAPAFREVGAMRKVKDAVARVAVWLCFLLAAAPLVWLLVTVVGRGLSAVLQPDWWTHSLNGVLPNDFFGGAYHAIVGTVYQGLITAVVSVPIGILVAVYLVEYGAGSPVAKVTTFMVDILTGIPSIVAGLFIYAVWITTAGLQRNTFAMCLALVLLAIPVVVRTTEEMLRIVPNELREASLALGVPKWKTIISVVLPTALSGIITGVMLAIARVMGETAPALILLSYADWINFNPFNGPMANLPLMINAQFLNPTDAGFQRTWGAALTLVLVIMVFNLAATIISRLSAIKKK
jgi:phosphate transport system permease protein